MMDVGEEETEETAGIAATEQGIGEVSRGTQTDETRVHEGRSRKGEPVELNEHSNLAILTVEQLKQGLGSRALPTGGSKNALILRVRDHLKDPEVDWLETEISICTHEETINGANATHAWRKCKACKKLLWRASKKTGAEEFVGVANSLESSSATVYSMDESQVAVILDSGCRRNVAVEVQQGEKFKFGDDRIALSHRAWQYPFKVGKKLLILELAEVESTCPPLICVTTMEQMNICIDFAEGKVKSENLGLAEDMVKSPSGHPVLTLSIPQLDDEDLPRCFGGPDEKSYVPVCVCEPMNAVDVMFEGMKEINIAKNYDRTPLYTEGMSPPRSLLLGAYTRRGAGVSVAAGKNKAFLQLVHPRPGRVLDQGLAFCSADQQDVLWRDDYVA